MRVLSIIAVIILVSATMFITVTRPQMHKRIVFGGANIQVAESKTETEAVETKVTPVQTETVKKEVDVQKVDNTDFQNELRLKALEALADKEAELKLAQEKAANAEKQAADIKKLKQQQEAEAKARKQAEKQAKKEAEELAKKQAQLEKEQEAARKQAEEKAKKAAEEQAKKAAAEKAAAEKAKKEAEEQAKKAAEEQKKLVEYQETILWNQWRATVCNKVASKLDKQFTAVAPPGTIYTYSFNVDENRRITNVTVKISKGYVNTSTQQGVNMIKYAINSLNLSSILTFPSGTQRTSVKVESGIERTANQSNSLNANSFNDVETITKQKYE